MEIVLVRNDSLRHALCSWEISFLKIKDFWYKKCEKNRKSIVVRVDFKIYPTSLV